MSELRFTHRVYDNGFGCVIAGDWVRLDDEPDVMAMVVRCTDAPREPAGLRSVLVALGERKPWPPDRQGIHRATPIN